MPNSETSNPYAKFLIGAFAGLCSSVFPVISTALVDPASLDSKFSNPVYQILIISFSLIVGITVLIFEWGKLKEPKATFMVALGIPALISGSIYNNFERVSIKSYQSEKKTIEAKLLESEKKSGNEIKIYSNDELYEINPTDSSVDWNLFKIFRPEVAYAQDKKIFKPMEKNKTAFEETKDQLIKSNSPDLAVGYVIILKTAGTLKKAREEEASLMSLGFKTKILSSKSGKFVIIKNDPPITLVEAIEKIKEIEKKHHITGNLIKVKTN